MWLHSEKIFSEVNEITPRFEPSLAILDECNQNTHIKHFFHVQRFDEAVRIQSVMLIHDIGDDG